MSDEKMMTDSEREYEEQLGGPAPIIVGAMIAFVMLAGIVILLWPR